ncbi:MULTISPECIES: Crp/Fnr family transcriptional regulator [Microcystis]|jgi:CRP-like cAMP-binding protein|uniref:Global nitrogen regulator n=2 Tax=Microcystis TaxID=1125 RepID=S3JJA3_MICAE|nr:MULTISPECIES: Crp/Fnr family transcriptional regulator [Microcystis]NCR97665.1 Crp/Fnr family transcriptional regulator [Microcystis aeruginosa L311-01]OCY14534.1 MAG: Crp/Fnr family transcriptional regulator [Microcystis aeruginosa CACIAM 03]TRU16158.1 MAG: Crp/Fnr family transcriptional regulator [Microcystis aeruginosa Ma_MB_F_20061100_S19]TRU16196.1 MAG: Crp/Fnr family transcriptional regulator [Microcystis aeruginosa Ma_MB_F_20061100_S19D]EPF20237.1 Global nitrogen regulator [Microcyst
MTLTYQPPTPHRWHFDNRAILPLRNPNFWKIESGVVKTSTWLEDGTLIVLGLWGPGNFVGKTLERVNPYQVECITPVQAVSFSTVESYQMAEILLSHLQQAQELSIIRSYKRTDVMVVKLLSWLGNQFGKQTGTGQLIDVRLTHQDIADLLGTTRVTITRALNHLEQQGAVERLPVHRLLLREEEIWHYEI